MRFQHVLKVIGTGLAAAAGVAVAIATLPVWVAPALAGAAAVAGTLATSPLDHAAVSAVREAARRAPAIAPGNAKVKDVAAKVDAVAAAIERARGE